MSVSNNLSKQKRQEIILKNKWDQKESYLNEFKEVMSEYVDHIDVSENDVGRLHRNESGAGVLNREIELVV